MAGKTTNLGTEPVGKLLLRLAVPAILAQVINMLYNIVDRIYIGHLPDVGSNALTGVGVTFSIIMIVSAFSALIGMGGGPRASIRMGGGDHEGAEKVLGNCFVSLLIVSVVLTAVFLTFQRPLLLMFGADEQTTLPYAMDYLTIYLCGTVFVQLALGLNIFITIQGFAKTSMLTVLIGAVLNIVLDPILMFGLNMGVRGAAVATIISQTVSALWVLRFLLGNRTGLRIKRKNLRLDHKIMLPVLALGLSPFIMNATESAVGITLTSSLKHYGGDMAVGAMTICTSLMQMVWMPLAGLSQGAQAIISFNFGAKNFDRVKHTFRLLLTCAVSSTVLIWGLVMLFPATFASLFGSDPKLMEIATWGLRIFMAGTCFLGVQSCCQQTFVALGESKVSLLLALLRKVILLIPLILILPLVVPDPVFGVFLAEPIADIIAVSVTGTIFFTRFPKILKRAELHA